MNIAMSMNWCRMFDVFLGHLRTRILVGFDDRLAQRNKK